jgi:putative oxidoreductase
VTVALATLLLRLAAGAIFVAQGSRKLLAPAGAPHGRAALAATIARQGWPQPARLAIIVAATELVGGGALLLGLGSRLVALPLGVVLLAAIDAKRRDGFLGGWDWPLSVLAIDLAILALGSGPWSVDGLLGLPWNFP